MNGINDGNTPVSPSPAGGSSPRPPRFGLSGRQWLVWLIVLLVFNVVFYAPQVGQMTTSSSPTISLPYSTFLVQVKAGNIKTASVSSSAASGDFKSPYKDPSSATAYAHYITTLLPIADPNLAGILTAHNVLITGTSSVTPVWLTVLGLVLSALPFLFFVGLIYFATRAARRQQQGVFGFGKSRAKLYYRGASRHHLRRCGRRRCGKERPARGSGVPARPRKVSTPRRTHSQRRAAGGTARHRQDAAGACRRG